MIEGSRKRYFDGQAGVYTNELPKPYYEKDGKILCDYNGEEKESMAMRIVDGYCMPDGIETEEDHKEYLKAIGL